MSGERVSWVSPLGVKLHWGQPPNPTTVHATTSWSSWPRRWTEHFVEHPIAAWYGISFRHRWFFGLKLFDPQTTERHGTLADRLLDRESSSAGPDDYEILTPTRGQIALSDRDGGRDAGR